MNNKISKVFLETSLKDLDMDITDLALPPEKFDKKYLNALNKKYRKP